MSVSALNQKYESERPAKSITGILPLKAELALVGVGTLAGGSVLWGLYYGITATGGALYGLNHLWSIIKNKQENDRGYVQQQSYLKNQEAVLKNQEAVYSDIHRNNQLKKRIVVLATTVALTVLFNYLYNSNCQNPDGYLCKSYSYINFAGVIGSLTSAGYTIKKAIFNK